MKVSLPINSTDKTKISQSLKSGQVQVASGQQQATDNTPVIKDQSVASGRVAGSKEQEVGHLGQPEAKIEAVAKPEVAISKEAKEAGIEIRPESPEIPPDLKKFGVKPSGPSQPVIHPGSDQTGRSVPAVSLPISDDQVLVGLHASVTSSFRWLAEWCLRRLRQAHLILKRIHGRVRRIRTD